MSGTPQRVQEWRERMLRRALWGALLVCIGMVGLAMVQGRFLAAAACGLAVFGSGLALWRHQWSMELRVFTVVFAGVVSTAVLMRDNGFLTPVNHAAFVGLAVFASLMMKARLALLAVFLISLEYLVVGVFFIATDRNSAVTDMLVLDAPGNWLRSGLLTVAILVVTSTWVLFVTRNLKSALSESQHLFENLRAESKGRIQALEKSAALDEELRQSQKLEAVGALASGVAHDFNNLLVAIMGHSQLIRYTSKDPRTARHCDAIMAASEQASALTGQLLAFSRRERGVQGEIDVAEELLRTKRILERLMPSNIELDFDIPEAGLGYVHAAPSDLGQIVLNLCVNARDAMDEGGRVEIRTRQLVEGEKPMLEIVVSDTGHGIPEELRQKIFEPFFTTKEIGKGTGIGLSLVARVAEALAATIEVESELGVGTTFTIRVPSSTGRGAVETDAAVLAPGQGECILLVDDDAGVREVVSKMLSEAGYRPELFASANDALDWYESSGEGPQLLITDAVMPGLGGFAFYQELAERGYRGPCLVCSGYSGVVPPSFFDDDSRRFLAKPFRAEALLAEVSALLHSE